MTAAVIAGIIAGTAIIVGWFVKLAVYLALGVLTLGTIASGIGWLLTREQGFLVMFEHMGVQLGLVAAAALGMGWLIAAWARAPHPPLRG